MKLFSNSFAPFSQNGVVSVNLVIETNLFAELIFERFPNPLGSCSNYNGHRCKAGKHGSRDRHVSLASVDRFASEPAPLHYSNTLS